MWCGVSDRERSRILRAAIGWDLWDSYDQREMKT